MARSRVRVLADDQHAYVGERPGEGAQDRARRPAGSRGRRRSRARRNSPSAVMVGSVGASASAQSGAISSDSDAGLTGPLCRICVAGRASACSRWTRRTPSKLAPRFPETPLACRVDRGIELSRTRSVKRAGAVRRSGSSGGSRTRRHRSGQLDRSRLVTEARRPGQEDRRCETSRLRHHGGPANSYFAGPPPCGASQIRRATARAWISSSSCSTCHESDSDY